MFESSLLSSPVQTSSRTRWIVMASILLQGTCVAALVLVPLLYPATLPAMSVAPKMTSIALYKRPEIKRVEAQPQTLAKPQTVATPQINSVHAPSAAQIATIVHGGSMPRTAGTPASEDPGVLSFGTLSMGSGPGALTGLGSGPGAPGPAVVSAIAPARHTGPVRVSTGVSEGLLLAPITPVYPRIAISTRTQGTVIVTATIDKQGRVINLQVISGPPMLRSAALEAVAAAHYRPFQLNGDPTEVITTISVNFHMDS